MEYDWEEIGNRIREMRKKTINEFTNKPYTLVDAAEKCHIGKNNLCDLENGDRKQISVNTLIEMSKLFDCDIGYLLGEYNTKKKDISDVQEMTGLSEKVIEMLANYHAKGALYLDIINYLLEDDNFINSLSDIINSIDCFGTEKLRQQAIDEEWANKAWFDINRTRQHQIDFQSGQICLQLNEARDYYALQAKMKINNAVESLITVISDEYREGGVKFLDDYIEKRNKDGKYK